jgi:uncharacterized protein GlcG (DUF336 family)
MDGADPHAAELAFRKAYTAAAFHVATADLAPQARRPLLRSLAIAHRGRILPVAGGLVIVQGIAILGAVGVAGARHPDQDILCSQAALAVLESSGH